MFAGTGNIQLITDDGNLTTVNYDVGDTNEVLIDNTPKKYPWLVYGLSVYLTHKYIYIYFTGKIHVQYQISYNQSLP